MTPPDLPVTPPDLDATLDEVLQEIDRPPNAWARLRALPTPARVALGVGIAAAFAGGVVAVLGMRTDLPDPMPTRFAAGVGMLALGAVVSAGLSIRGIHRPPLGRIGLAVAGALAGVALVTPWLGVWPGEANHGAGLGCLAVGTLAAGLAGGALVGLARARAQPLEQRVLAGVSGGLVGFAMNEAWCSAGDAPHLLLGHASLAVVGGVLVAWVGGVWRR